MSMQIRTASALVLAILLVVGGTAASDEDTSSVTIAGSIGLSAALESSCIAAWVPLGEGLAISGVTWYNNDGTMAFPEVLVQGGFASQGTTTIDALQVATNVGGPSSGWGQLNFGQPIATDNEGVYVIFRIPAGAAAVSDGAGGGPAIGYTASGSGCTGWLSADGEDWMQIQPSFHLAVLPTIVKARPGMAVKSNSSGALRAEDPLADPSDAPESKSEIAVKVTGLEPASPNPFNPTTTLRFSLATEADVTLTVFSIRGELVRQLVSEHLGQGSHAAVWDGKDSRGRTVASGVYLARLVAGPLEMTQRLMLMK